MLPFHGLVFCAKMLYRHSESALAGED